MTSVAEILNGLKGQINKEMVKKTKTIFVFEIDGKHWTLNLKTGDGSLEEGKPKKADCTLIMTEAVFLDMFTGKMNPQTGFMQGKYKIKGNLMVRTSFLSLQLHLLLLVATNAKLCVICYSLLSLLSLKFSSSPLIISVCRLPKSLLLSSRSKTILHWLVDLSL